MIISNEELCDKLGIKQNNKLKQWLSSRKIPFDIDGHGRIITTEQAIDHHFMRDKLMEERWEMEWEK